MRELWEYYCDHLERPVHSPTGEFLAWGTTARDTTLLPVMRRLYARHLRDLRRQQRVRAIASINSRYVHVPHNPGPVWGDWAWPELSRSRAFLRKSDKSEYLTAWMLIHELRGCFY